MVDGSNWRLGSNLFRQKMTQEGPLLCDLFAARHNRQLPRYVSWQPDPEAVAVDALSLAGGSRVGRCLPLSSICTGRAMSPVYTASPDIQSGPSSSCLERSDVLSTGLSVAAVTQDPALGLFVECHPMEADWLQLAVWPQSGQPQVIEDFQQTLPVNGSRLGVPRSSPVMSQLGTSGFAGVSGNRWIPWKVMRWLWRISWLPSLRTAKNSGLLMFIGQHFLPHYRYVVTSYRLDNLR